MALLTPARTTSPRPAAGQRPSAEVRGHHRSFGGTHVLRGVDLTSAGASSSPCSAAAARGKSTLLRSLAGLDRDVGRRGRRHRPAPSVAFQEPRLLPWRSVGATSRWRC